MDEDTRHGAYVGTTEAASLLGITRQAVLKRIRAGTLPARKVGRNYVIPAAAVRPTASADPVLAEIVRRLVGGYDPERVYLFGSAARGEAGIDSDYDIMLVVPDDAGPRRRRPRMAHEDLLDDVDAPVDVLVMTRSAFDAKAEVIGALPEIILHEGVLMYVA
jgi:excisionase family DNA binding protein